MNANDGAAAGAAVWSDVLPLTDHAAFRLDTHGTGGTSMVLLDILDAVPDWARLRDDVDRTSRSLVRMRQRIISPALPIAAARWVTDPDFDLDYHLRRLALPAPGSFRQLLDLARILQASPLDPDRSLWEATLVEELHEEQGGAAAIIWKFDHTVTDGLGRQVFERVMRSEERDIDRGPLPKLPSPADLSSADLTRREVRRLPLVAGRTLIRAVGDAAALVSATVRDPASTVSTATRLVESAQRIAGPPPAPPSPLLARRGRNRRLDTLDVALADLRKAAREHRCSVTDVAIAAVCGALRIYHDELGVPVDSLPLAIPVGLGSDDDPAGGRLWSGLRIAAPVGVADAVQRLRLVREAVSGAQSEPAATALRVLAPAVAWLPDQFLATVTESGTGADVLVGNGAGQPGTAYVAGARLSRVIPIAPLLGAAVSIALYSMDGRCHIGVNQDRLSVTDPALFLKCLHRGFDEVIAAGGVSVGVIGVPRKRSPGKRSPRTPTRRGGSK